MHGRFHDSAISVREASIDLVGRFLLIQPDLTAQYYPMLAERILVSHSQFCLVTVFTFRFASSLQLCVLSCL